MITTHKHNAEINKKGYATKQAHHRDRRLPQKQKNALFKYLKNQ